MALFRFTWLRAFIRRHTRPIPQQSAETWKQRLSLGYMLLAWNAFGFVMYMVYTGKGDWAKAYGLKSEAELQLTPAQQWTRSLGIKDATVYRMEGLKVSKYEVHNDFEEMESTKQLNESKKTENSEDNETLTSN